MFTLTMARNVVNSESFKSDMMADGKRNPVRTAAVKADKLACDLDVARAEVAVAKAEVTRQQMLYRLKQRHSEAKVADKVADRLVKAVAELKAAGQEYGEAVKAFKVGVQEYLAKRTAEAVKAEAKGRNGRRPDQSRGTSERARKAAATRQRNAEVSTITRMTEAATDKLSDAEQAKLAELLSKLGMSVAANSAVA